MFYKEFDTVLNETEDQASVDLLALDNNNVEIRDRDTSSSAVGRIPDTQVHCSSQHSDDFDNMLTLGALLVILSLVLAIAGKPCSSRLRKARSTNNPASSKANSPSKTVSKPESKRESKPNSGSIASFPSKSTDPSKAGSKADFKGKSKSNAKPKPKAKPKAKSKVNPKTKSKAESKPSTASQRRLKVRAKAFKPSTSNRTERPTNRFSRCKPTRKVPKNSTKSASLRFSTDNRKLPHRSRKAVPLDHHMEDRRARKKWTNKPSKRSETPFEAQVRAPVKRRLDL
eukprot:1349311-Amorphochlora_amoeboformis.AAC.2